MDRIDIFVEVPPVEYAKLVDEEPAEDSSVIRERVERSRVVQARRFGDTGILCNSEMGASEVLSLCNLDQNAKSLLQTATNQLNLSARGFHRIIKVSRTIADLDESEEIGVSHLAEALQYRSRGLN
jgi:magnesium chelatase family protein